MENRTMSRLAFNGMHLSFSEEELIKSKERIKMKEASEYFGVLPGTIQRYSSEKQEIIWNLRPERSMDKQFNSNSGRKRFKKCCI